MYILGTILIVCSITAAGLASMSYMVATRGSKRARAYGRWCTRTALGAALLVAALLVYAFVTRRYDIQYVYSYSASDLPLHYRVAAIWAGQPGSLLIWALWSLIVAQVLARTSRHAEPYVLSVFMLIPAALLGLMGILDPFAPYVDTNGASLAPADGHGLNPLLQNPWMVIHPPILFLSYALLGAPFALALGGLWQREYDGWARQALPWTLAGWVILGMALLLGGYWAYETLGWGGYWGWDSVENSGLVAWLATTALIHALLVQRAGGGLRRMSLVLALTTYLLVFYATYLTRSGVLANFSVHTFAQESIRAAITAGLLALVVGAGSALGWRWRAISARPLSENLLSRDSFVILALLGMLLIAALIALGTSMPLISAIPGVGHWLQPIFGAIFDVDEGTRFNLGLRPFSDGRFALTSTFYTTTVPPLGVVLALLLTIGPLLGWHGVNVRHLLRALRWPFLAAISVTCGAILLGVRDALPLAYLSLGSFAAGTNLVMIARMLKSGWLRIGGYLAHVGMAVLVAGIIGSTFYAVPEQQIVAPEGQPIGVYGYVITFNGWRVTPENTGVLDLTVTRGNELFRALPQLYFVQREGATMKTPAIKRELLRDLYIAPVDYRTRVDPNTAQLLRGDTRPVGSYTLTLTALDIPDSSEVGTANVNARLRVRYQERTSDLVAKVKIERDAAGQTWILASTPVRLPGGHTARLETFDPVRNTALVRVEGLNLPVEPALAVVTVSLKPGIALVWIGVLISALGGAIAVIRRALEGQARRAVQPARMPRGIGLARVFHSRRGRGSES
ncbi:cytochrome C biogenesis protein [Kouleothrix aurantiaca]|uniref:Cytochrome C biogenesis protein n=1 Tax=Kouleothrix aurantiaca TaxID=186479 RepID=A0A0P9DA54_9CHLR|nr:cytochrome C biogenesis protein [Kouleothrix aurantiaca]